MHVTVWGVGVQAGQQRELRGLRELRPALLQPDPAGSTGSHRHRRARPSHGQGEGTIGGNVGKEGQRCCAKTRSEENKVKEIALPAPSSVEKEEEKLLQGTRAEIHPQPWRSP